ncbi:hypothetical protein KEF29_37160 [Streptomyces tuirus]|uniref:Uncharacterized protein n=1 Tax=Streptomyces tuirus TaxID=68278 RepID=A0A941FKF0_9ACTN|nr:hypothetical protein [Streptomyces tuirus]
MSGGSAKPKRRKAAGAALRYEHRRGRPAVGRPKRPDWGCAVGCAVIPGVFVLLTPLYFFDMYWGHDLWSDLAPTWPGGAYAFAATVGALVPLVFLLWVWPLTRMNWKKSKPRSLGWAAASLPGLAAGYVVAGVIMATTRPKRRRDWDSGCYSEGGSCWVHVHYPWLWAVGLVATLTVIVLLITLFVKYGGRSSPTAPSTSEPEAGPTPRSPSGTGGRRPPA